MSTHPPLKHRKTSEILREARSLIACSDNWLKRSFATDYSGTPLTPHVLGWAKATSSREPAEARCFCSEGALHHAINDGKLMDAHNIGGATWMSQLNQCKAVLVEAITGAPWAGYRLFTFNDDPTTKHSDVIAVFDRAIDLSERRGD